MDKSVLFWVVMLIWLVFGITPPPASIPYWRFGNVLLLFVLLGLLGWQVFGKAIK